MENPKVKRIGSRWYEIDSDDNQWELTRVIKKPKFWTRRKIVLAVLCVVFGYALVSAVISLITPAGPNAQINPYDRNDIRINLFYGCMESYDLKDIDEHSDYGTELYNTTKVWRSIWSCLDKSSLMIVDKKTGAGLLESTSLVLFTKCVSQKMTKYQFQVDNERSILWCFTDLGTNIIYKPEIVPR